MKSYTKFKLISMLVGLVCFFSTTIAYADLEVNTTMHTPPHNNYNSGGQDASDHDTQPVPQEAQTEPKGFPEVAVDEEIAVLFLSRCGPTEAIARFLQVQFGEIPFLQGIAFQHSPSGAIYEGKIMITMNPATKTYTVNFVIGGMTCMISNGAELNVAGGPGPRPEE